MGRIRNAGILAFLLCVPAAGTVFAATADVLPKGVWRTNVRWDHYLPVTERYDPNGNPEPLAIDYNGNLNSNVFEALKLLEQPNTLPPPLVALPPGTASIGSSLIRFEYEVERLWLQVDYGISDRLSVGAKVPYIWAKNNVTANLDNSTATVGKFAPLATLLPLGQLPGTQPLTSADAQALFGGGLDIDGNGTIDIPGLGYKRVEPWSGSGFGDLQVGFRYQYFKTVDWRLAVTGTVQFPTGKVDDPASIVDIGLGSGAYVFSLESNNTWQVTPHLNLDAAVKFNYMPPTHLDKRVPQDVNQPIAPEANQESVEIDIGDSIVVELGGQYNFAKGFFFGASYIYGAKKKDTASGSKGLNYKSLEDETRVEEQIYKLDLSYSTVELFAEKKFPVPMTVGISYLNRFAGENNVWKSEVIRLEMSVFF